MILPEESHNYTVSCLGAIVCEVTAFLEFVNVLLANRYLRFCEIKVTTTNVSWPLTIYILETVELCKTRCYHISATKFSEFLLKWHIVWRYSPRYAIFLFCYRFISMWFWSRCLYIFTCCVDIWTLACLNAFFFFFRVSIEVRVHVIGWQIFALSVSIYKHNILCHIADLRHSKSQLFATRHFPFDRIIDNQRQIHELCTS